jgi:predicted 3-demethylubiquinone-9 3-methyltransferase (glyoxalase superfamily)
MIQARIATVNWFELSAAEDMTHYISLLEQAVGPRL